MGCLSRPTITFNIGIVLFALSAGTPSAQQLQPEFWTVDGAPGTPRQVNAIAGSGNTVYIGGRFTSVGPATGSWASLDSGSGLAQLPYAGVNGTVDAAVSDGMGGWYIGGTFTHVQGQSRENLARVLADGSLADWNPGTNGSVQALAASGDTIYVGGSFTTIGGEARNRIAAVDGATGVPIGWDPNAGGSSSPVVTSLVVSNGTVYAAGAFNTIGGTYSPNLAALEAATGLPATVPLWSPPLSGATPVRTLLAMSGSILYVGGQFTSIGPATGGGASLDALTGQVMAPWSGVEGRVHAAVPDGTGGWFIGGQFTSVQGQARTNLAHIESDGSVGGWNPAANGTVNALAVSGNLVYAGGEFTLVGGQARNRIAAVDAMTAVPTDWNPNAGGIVNALAVSDSVIYAGGSFTTIGGTTRNRIAALDRISGMTTPWNPNAGSTVFALAVSGNVIYAGGIFTTIGGATRNRIAALERASGAATPWDPSAGGAVHALTVSGSLIYAGGSFSTIGGAARNRIAALDAASGTATPWDPNAGSTVNALAVSGSLVYAGGSFTSIGGASRSRIAALDAGTGMAAPWNPGAENTVNALAVSGGVVYAGGSFASVGGRAQEYLAAIDVMTGAPTNWDPDPFLSVTALAVADGTVYVSGSFTAIGGQVRNRFAAIDAATGLVGGWNPNADGPAKVLLVSGGAVYAGGSFTSIGGQTRYYIAALDPTTGAATAWDPAAGRTVNILGVSGSAVFAGGEFATVGRAVRRSNIAALDATTGQAMDWSPAIGLFTSGGESGVFALAPSEDGGTIYAGGTISTVNGASRSRLAAIDAETGQLEEWIAASVLNIPRSIHVAGTRIYTGGTNGVRANDAATGALLWSVAAGAPVRAIALSGSTIYAGGDFVTMGGLSRTRGAAIDTDSGTVLPWNANAGAAVYALAVSGNTVYAGGFFSSIGGTVRDRIAALDGVSALATDWNPGSSSGVYALVVSDQTVFAGGIFSTLGGQPRERIAAIDASTGQVTEWNPSIEAPTSLTGVLALLAFNGTLCTGGSFLSVDGSARWGFAAFTISGAAGVETTISPVMTLALGPSIPNPVQRSSRISFSLPSAGRIDLTLYDIAGREVARMLDDTHFGAGPHEVQFAPDLRLAAGIYWYRLKWNGTARSERLVLLPR